MEKKIVEIAKRELAVIEKKPISRKEAIKKTGLIAASAATMMLLLGSPKAQACSPAPPPSKPKPPSGGHDSPWH